MRILLEYTEYEVIKDVKDGFDLEELKINILNIFMIMIYCW